MYFIQTPARFAQYSSHLQHTVITRKHVL